MSTTNALGFYEQLIATNPAIERKGKTMPYTSHNGNMFTFLAKDGKMGLRLSKDDCEAFVQKFGTNYMEQHGRLMKEYVEIPVDLLKDTETLSPYLQKSWEYVATLKPKPSKKK